MFRGLLFAGAFWLPLAIAGLVIAFLPWLWWNGGILEVEIPRHQMSARSDLSVSVRIDSLLRQTLSGWRYQKGSEPTSFFFRVDSATDSRLELYEDRARLGPAVADAEEVRDLGQGRFAYRAVDLLFSASNGGNPRQVEHSYSVRRLTRPRIGVLQVTSATLAWSLAIFLVGSFALRWRRSWESLVDESEARSSFSALVVLFIYTTYVFCFCSLEGRLSLYAYCILAAISGILMMVGGQRVAVKKWMLWPAVFVAYAVTRGALFEGSYESCSTGRELLLTSLLGVVVFSALNLEPASREGRGLVFRSVFLLLSFLLVIQDFGIEVRSLLWRVDPGFLPWKADVWHRKFQETWFLVLSWSGVSVLADEWQRRRVFVFAYLGIAGAVVFLGYSLSVKVAMVVSLTIFSLAYFFPRLAWRGLLLAFILSFLMAPVAARAIWEYSVGSGSFAGSRLELHLTERLVTWRYASMLIAKHPWLGWGLGASGNLPGSVRSETAEKLLTEVPEIPEELASLRALPGGHPHSLPLLIWLDLGAVGIALAIAVLVTIFGQIRRVEDRFQRSAIMALVSSVLLIFEFSYPMWQPTLQLFLLVSAGAVCSTGVWNSKSAAP